MNDTTGDKHKDFTMLPHEFVDKIMPTLTPSAVVLSLYMARHTLGKGNDRARLSLREVVAGSGLSKRTIQRSIVETKGVVEVTHEPGKALLWRFLIEPRKGDARLTPVPKVTTGETTRGVKSDQGRCQIGTPNKEEEDPLKENIPASAKRVGRKSSNKTFDCQHSTTCSNLPWHICRLIAEAADLEPSGFRPAELSQAKRLAGVLDADIEGTVRYMLEVNGDFWNRRKRITPAAVEDNLLLYRKQARKNPNRDAPAMTEAELDRLADQQEAQP